MSEIPPVWSTTGEPPAKTPSTSVDGRRTWHSMSSPSHSTCTVRYTLYTAAYSLPQHTRRRTHIPHTKAHMHTAFSARQRVLLSLPTARASHVPHKGTQIIDLSKLREQQSPFIVFALATNTGIALICAAMSILAKSSADSPPKSVSMPIACQVVIRVEFLVTAYRGTTSINSFTLDESGALK